MEVIFIMIALSLLMALGFLYAFVWSMKSGQNNDLYTPSVRILFEENSSAGKEIELENDITQSKSH